MRARHKIPTIFNLSMVDVLCCALGCVILLWLLNFREAKRRIAAADATTALLARARTDLDAASHENADAQQRLETVEQRLRETQDQMSATVKDRDKVNDNLAKSQSRIAELGKEITALKTAATGAEERLLKKTQEQQAVAKELAAMKATAAEVEARLTRKTQDYLALLKEKEATAKQLDSTQQLLRERETAAKVVARSIDDLADKLRDADARSKKLQPLPDQVAALQKELQGYRDKLSTAETRALALERDLGNQKGLIDQANRARAAAENRFAGIQLTGRRVVFLVDMSGSMDYVDEKTPDPQKWRGVRESLASIARSLPELEKFQVVIFSDKASYLLGSEDRWIDFDAKTSVDRIIQALAATKPKGNTNMYAAFEAAFRLRTDGLDTIYLLSDGLPNMGAGLTPEQARKLTEVEQSGILSANVLKTLKVLWNRPLAGKSRVRIHAVGFFYESPDVGAFLWALARENDGSFVGMSKP